MKTKLALMACVTLALASCQSTASKTPTGTTSAPSVAPTPAAAASAQAASAQGQSASPIPSLRIVEKGVEFSLKRPEAKAVYLAGTFNGWAPDADLMTKGEDGVWRIVIPLDDGTHKYKFVIDKKWEHDPLNPKTVPDGFGGKNSVLVIDNGKIILK